MATRLAAAVSSACQVLPVRSEPLSAKVVVVFKKITSSIPFSRSNGYGQVEVEILTFHLRFKAPVFGGMKRGLSVRFTLRFRNSSLKRGYNNLLKCLTKSAFHFSTRMKRV